MEVEENGCLPFLDVLVKRDENGSLNTAVYRKPTHTDRLLDFDSYHPVTHKRSVVKTLHKRAQRVCSSNVDYRRECDYLKNVFKMNGYPASMLNQCIRESDRANAPRLDLNKKIVIPYIKGCSEIAARTLAEGDVFVAHKPSNSLKSSLVNLKDHKPTDETSGVVYSIPCTDCDHVYVGETGRKLKTRMSEHTHDIDRMNESSRVAMHERDTGHDMNVEDCKILYKAKRLNQRLFLESWSTNDISLNRCIDLNPVYSACRE